MYGQSRASENDLKREEHRRSRQVNHHQQNDDEYLQTRQITTAAATLEQAKQEEQDKIDLSGSEDVPCICTWQCATSVSTVAYIFLVIAIVTVLCFSSASRMMSFNQHAHTHVYTHHQMYLSLNKTWQRIGKRPSLDAVLTYYFCLFLPVKDIRLTTSKLTIYLVFLYLFRSLVATTNSLGTNIYTNE